MLGGRKPQDLAAGLDHLTRHFCRFAFGHAPAPNDINMDLSTQSWAAMSNSPDRVILHCVATFQEAMVRWIERPPRILPLT